MTATGSVREYLADALTFGLAQEKESWTIYPYAYTPTQVRKDKPVASVFRSSLGPGETALVLDHTVTVNVYAAKTLGGPAEDELDGLHDSLLVVLQALNPYTWTNSTRVEFSDGTLAGWEITGTVTTGNIYRSHIIKEREIP